MSQPATRPQVVWKTLAITFALLLALIAVVVLSGAYNIGADAPHTKAVSGLLELTRERSISEHSSDLEVPSDLASPQRIATGAGLYAEMCSQCHLGPGVAPTEISQGLYPPAPKLAENQELDAKGQFWVIKHGIKLTAMPAWGKTHDDALIWDMVAFVRGLPKMSAEQYRAAIADAPADHDAAMSQESAGHSHADDGHHHDHE